MAANSRLEELDEAQCLNLLATISVGRVGISSEALPAILPVNFVLHHRDILFRTVAAFPSP
jgi:nitroimidazol reductase NimA-like FMN-containing flavoprotein (pyridoxamine 5'-phosphate oxidase superfamily)